MNNVASPLFAVAMGMGAAIMVQRAGSQRETMIHNVIRSLLIVALGWWLSTWDTWVAIVLEQLGLTLLIGTFLLRLPRRWVAILAVVLAVAADPVNAWVANHAPEAAFAPQGPIGWLERLFFTDIHYRVTNLLPMFLLGATIYYSGWVRSPGRRSCLAMIVGGVLLNGLGSRWLSSQTVVRSGSIPDTIADLGLVLVALGVVGLAAGVKQLQGVLREISLIGTVALSLYVLQVAIVALMAGDGGRPPAVSREMGLLLTGILVIAVPLVAWAWSRWVGRGPIEEAIGRLSGRYRHHPAKETA